MISHWVRGVVVGALGVVLFGCGALDTPYDAHLSTEPGKLGKPARAPYTIENVLAQQPGEAPRTTLIVFAFSGGGKRSAAFGYGVLKAAHALALANGTTLGDSIDIVTGVSGGSFTASAYAIKRDHLFDADALGPHGAYDDFLTDNLTLEIAGIYLLPWKWGWVVHNNVGTNDEMADVYEQALFEKPGTRDGYTFGDLAQPGRRPFLIVQATDLDDHMPVTFTQNDFDLVCNDLSQYRVARAVAASNGFPILFSPIGVEMYSFEKPWAKDARPDYCPEVFTRDDYKVGPDATYDLDGELNQFETGLRPADGAAVTGRKSYLHLADGGLADNLALHGLIDLWTRLDMQITQGAATCASDRLPECAAVDKLGLRNIRNILIVSVDGEAEPTREESLNVPVISGVTRTVGTVTNAVIDNNNLQTLPEAYRVTQALADGIGKLRCGAAYKTCRPYAVFTQVALADWAARPARTKDEVDIATSSTGLSLATKNKDVLVQAGMEEFATSASGGDIGCFLRALRGDALPASCPSRVPGQ